MFELYTISSYDMIISEVNVMSEQIYYGMYCPSCLDNGFEVEVERCPFCGVKYKKYTAKTYFELMNYIYENPKIMECELFNKQKYNERLDNY